MPNQATRPRQALMASWMSERQLQQAVSDLCRHLNLLHFHPLNSKGMRAGWPDSVIVGPLGILYRELKSERGHLTAEQRSVGEALKAAGANFGIWRPRHWIDGSVERELRMLLPAPTLPLAFEGASR
jgi:hypothetical protein